MYGMIQPIRFDHTSGASGVHHRRQGQVRCILYYPQSTGRNFDEIKRIVIALQKLTLRA